MQEKKARFLFGSIYILIMCFGTYYSEFSYRLLFGILGAISIYEMCKLRKEKTKFIALMYVILPFLLIQLQKLNLSYIFLMFILTWTFDTFAYITGLRFGKTKIMTSISPKKSWEGFIGGWIFTIIAGYIASYYLESVNLRMAISVSLFLPFTATFGDFIESYYKRKAGVKDSGNLIPGHGGLLDRMDAFMITIPVLYIYFNLIK